MARFKAITDHSLLFLVETFIPIVAGEAGFGCGIGICFGTLVASAGSA